MTRRLVVCVLCVSSCVLAVGCSREDEEATVRLSGVDDAFFFPLPAGGNRIITAAIQGAAARHVWLVPDGSKTVRLALKHVGDSQYQINLAEPSVSAALSGLGQAPGGGQFRIVAETVDGRTIESVAVRYTVWRDLSDPYATGTSSGATCLVRIGGKPRTVTRWTSGSEWFAVEEVEKITLIFPPGAAGGQARARAGDQTWAFNAPDKGNATSLAMTDAIGQAWALGGELAVESQDARGRGADFRLRAVPKGLVLAKPKTFTVHQRSIGKVPGSNGYLTVHLDDITGGQVLTDIRAGDRLVSAEDVSMRAGQSLPFAFADKRYVVTVVKMVNHLMSDDCCVLEVAELTDDQWRQVKLDRIRIQALLDAIGKSGATLAHIGGKDSAVKVAKKLNGDFPWVDAKAGTLAQFVEQLHRRMWFLDDQACEATTSQGEKTNARQYLAELVAQISKDWPSPGAASAPKRTH